MRVHFPITRINRLPQIRTRRLLAVLPVFIAAILNTGKQYLDARVALGESDLELSILGWRDRWATSLGVEAAESGIYDIVVAGLVHVLPILVTAVLTSLFWERVVCEARNHRFHLGVVWSALFSAMLFTLMLPPAVPIFHIVIGMSFAMVIGSAVFGGEGKSFLNPVVIGIALLQVSFPTAMTDHLIWSGVEGYSGTGIFAMLSDAGTNDPSAVGVALPSAFLGSMQGLIGTTSILAIIIGGIVLVNAGIASLRLIVAQFAGVILASYLVSFFDSSSLDLAWYWHVCLGSFGLGAVFLATDPGSSSSTDVGRLVQGLFVGFLIVVLRVVDPSHPDGVVQALLLGSMMAPLIDHLVIRYNVRRRTLHDG